MVSSPTTYSRNGLTDWVLQRVTALLIGSYAIFMIAYLLCHHHLDFQTWHNLFSCGWMKLFTLLAVGSILIHAWIGLWIVFTDYVKPYWLRMILQILVALILISLVFWTFDILWRLV